MSKLLHITSILCSGCGAPQKDSHRRSMAWLSPQSDFEKSKVTAGVPALLPGGIGIHKFDTGARGWGMDYIALCWMYVPALMALVEGIRDVTLKQPAFEKSATCMDGSLAFLCWKARSDNARSVINSSRQPTTFYIKTDRAVTL